MVQQVADQVPRIQYTASAGQTVFPYPFQIFVADDITVEQNGIIITAYTLSDVGTVEGGDVTLTVGADLNDIVTVYRTMAFERDTDYQDSGDFLADTVDNDFNRLWLALQQNREELSRSLQYAVDDIAGSNLIPLLAARTNKVLGFDNGGSPVMFNQPSITPGVNTIINSIAAMRALTPANGDQVFVTGYYSNGDQGGGNYTFNSASSVTDNGGSVVAPDVTAGRWELSWIHSLSVKQFGATGDNSGDDSAAIQACVDAVMLTGGEVYIPQGIYRVLTQILIDMDGKTPSPISDPRRLNVRGDGKGNTILSARTASSNCMKVKGTDTATGTELTHGYFTISNLCFHGSGSGQNSANGLRLSDIAYCSVLECSFFALAAGIVLDGSLSNNFSGLVFSDNVRGVSANAGAVSGAHANMWTGCEWRQCSELAYDGFTTTSQAVFTGCQFEGCGTQGDSTTGGLIFRMTGSAGEVGPTFYGCYFEQNGGGFDVKATESSTRRISIDFFGCNFNRIGATKFVTNNIVTEGEIDINLSGCSFTSYNSYVPDAGRPYILADSQARIRNLGNRFEDAIESPEALEGISFPGYVEGALGVSVVGTVPPNWTVNQVSTGIFNVAHNLNLDAKGYAVTATCVSGNARAVQRVVQFTNSFHVLIVNTADTVDDEDFTFSMAILKPVN